MMGSLASLSRRAVLKLAASSTIVTALSAVTTTCGRGKPGLEPIAERMIAVLNHPYRAHKLGALYLSQTPEVRSDSYEQMTRRLLAVLELETDKATHDVVDSLHGRLRARIRQDFVDENVVVVSGFMLSRIEAMLCALAYIYS